MRAIWCYLTYVSGATVDEQVRALVGAEVSELDTQRHRNRVYKLRERGRKALRLYSSAAER